MRARELMRAAVLAAFCFMLPALLLAQTAPLTITSSSPLPTGIVGSPYAFTFQATGGVGPAAGYPYSWSLAAGTLPPGLSLNSSGLLSGTPTTAGSYSFRIRVADIQGATAVKDFSMSVGNPVQIQTPAQLPAGAAGVPYSQTLIAAGGMPPYYWEAYESPLPPGISLTPAGVLTGTPGVVGTYTFVVTVYDATERSDSRTFTLTILNPISIATASPLPNGAVGVTYSQTLVAVGGAPPYTWSVTTGQLPPGLFLNPNGVFTGAPAQDGIFAFVAQVRDSAGLLATKVFSLTVAPRLEITTESTLPRARVGTAYRQLFEASGGVPPYTWSSADPMPPGLSFESAGAVSGRPTTAGTFSFSVTVTDSRGVTANKRFSLTVLPPLLSITTTSPLPNGRVGQAYSLTFAASGGTAPLTWSATGLPPGLQFSSGGALTGTPTATGSFTIAVTVTDAARETASGRFAITITAAPLEITTATLPRARVAESYSVTLAAEGGAAPYSWSAATVPGGLSLSATGVLSGIPGTPGTYTITVTVTDSEKNTASRQLTLVVDPPRLVFTTTSPLPAGRVGDAYSTQLTAAGGVPPYRWTATGVPAGLSLSAAGVLSGTPTVAGSFTLNVTVTDSAQGSVSQNFALTIATPPVAITTASLASGTVGAAYAATLAATGGQAPYSWSLAAGALPAGVTLSAGGELRGTPTAPGTFNFTARVTDSRGEQATRALSVTIALPALPRTTIQGLDANVNPAQQPQVSVVLDSAFPILVNGRLTLTFTSDATNPADDPAVQFSTGGRTVDFTIPAGQTRAVFPAANLAIQTGTVAGRIVVTAQFTAGGVNVTPTPAPSFTATVRAAAPVISRVRATRTSTGIEVEVVGFSTPRAMTQAVFRFTPSGAGTLQTTELTVPLDTVFTTWYRSDASRAFGSSFTYTQPFTVTGNVAAIGSVSVTLVNAQGSSQSMSAAIQ